MSGSFTVMAGLKKEKKKKVVFKEAGSLMRGLITLYYEGRALKNVV